MIPNTLGLLHIIKICIRPKPSFCRLFPTFREFFFDINPGLSFLTYRLEGMKSINHLTPRLQARATYKIDKVQQLQFMLALGNTYPRINTINNVEQQIDPIIILKGNPKMDNSILLNPRLSHTLNLNKFALQTGVSYFYQIIRLFRITIFEMGILLALLEMTVSIIVPVQICL